MTTVCEKCGVKGFEELLVFCEKCQTSAEHRYCLDKMPKLTDWKVHWLCEQCGTRDPKVDTSDSVGIRRRKKRVIRRRPRLSIRVSLLKRSMYNHLRKSCNAKTYPNVDKSPTGTSHGLEKNVLNVATMSKESTSVKVDQGDLLLASEKNDVHPDRENHEHLGNEIEGRMLKRRRKLILDDESDEDAPPLIPIDNFTDDMPYRSTTHLNKPFMTLFSPQNSGSGNAQPDKLSSEFAAEYCTSPVSPIVHPVWRGYFNICGRKYGHVLGHLSSRACEKVLNTADMLPQVLHFERLRRLEVWPKSFKCTAPTDDNIALYFFAGDLRAKKVLEELLDDVLQNDLALKAIVGMAELLVFSSMSLPQECHSFEGERYLWGVFRTLQGPRFPTTPEIHYSRLSEIASSADKYQHHNVSRDVPANRFSRLNVEALTDDDDNAFREPPSLMRGVPDKHPFRSNEVVEEPIEENEDALLRRHASRPCLPPDKSHNFVKVAHESVERSSDSNAGEDKDGPVRREATRPCPPTDRSWHFAKALDESVSKAVDSSMEFNFTGEGELDASLASCLELFPLEVEDLGITTKVQGSDEVDLELGLETIKDRRFECKPALEGKVVFLFGRAIC